MLMKQSKKQSQATRISSLSKSGSEQLQLDNNKIAVSIPRQHYFPPSIYCSFLKMAYSIMPLNLYPQYVKHIVVLQQLVFHPLINSTF